MTDYTVTGRKQAQPEMQRIPGTLRLLKQPVMPAMDYSSAEKRLLVLNGYIENKETGVWTHDPSYVKPVGVQVDGPKNRELKSSDGSRPISFERAKAQFSDRFTMNHIPAWASKRAARAGGKYPGPHYATDVEWYEDCEFIGFGNSWQREYYRERNPTFPLGKWLDKPFDTATVFYQPKEDPRKVKKAERSKARREKAVVPTKVVDMILASAKKAEAEATAKAAKEAAARARIKTALAVTKTKIDALLVQESKKAKFTVIDRPKGKQGKKKPQIVTTKAAKPRTKSGRK